MTTPAKASRPQRAPLASYANYFEVGHNPYEFLLDFGQFQPEVAEVLLHTRIVLGPAHARLFAEILARAVEKYETENGPIVEIPGKADPSRGPDQEALPADKDHSCLSGQGWQAEIGVAGKLMTGRG